MPQDSVVYGVARIRCHEKGLLKADTLKRMLEGSAEEAVRQLVDLGYGSLSSATSADVEQMVANELSAAYALVEEVTFQPKATDVFLMKADVHNLKLLLKLRLTQSRETSSLMRGGVYKPDVLARMVETSNYRDFARALSKKPLVDLEQSFQLGVDSARISTALDRAYVQYAYNTKISLVVSYFKARADFDNVLAMLRLRQAGNTERLRTILLPEGDVPQSVLLTALEAPAEGLVRLVALGPAKNSIRRGVEALQKGQGIAVLERERDDYLMNQFTDAWFDTTTIAPGDRLSSGPGAGSNMHPPDLHGKAERAARQHHHRKVA